MATATTDSVKDLRRRVDVLLERSPVIAREYASPRSGPGARSSGALRETRANGWLAMATAGSAAQLSSRTVRVVVADEIARWPRRVRSGEGAPLQLVEARQQDWGDDAILIALSSPVTRNDGIDLLFRDGDRRRLEYSCLDCGERTPFLWEHVTGRERGETPGVACAACGSVHDESARRRMLRTARWVPQRDDPTDEDCASFHASRLDSRRSSLAQVTKAWRKARLRVERGDPNALRAFRNLALGLPGESGAADVDRLYELRTRKHDVDMEQVTAGVDVQADRLVHVVLGFASGNTAAVVLDHGSTLGDTTEDDVWATLAASLARPFERLPVSVVSVDAGFATSTVRRQCSLRRWWLPVVGRAGDGKPIARRPGPTGIATMGADDASSWWSARVNAGRVHLPLAITRAEIGELCAAEALTAEGGALRWRPVEGRANHLWDAAKLAVHARHFRPLTRTIRRPRLVAV